jgi:AraC-like DNA-binding protein
MKNLVYYDDEILKKVEDNLQSSLLTGFPGITALSKLHFISETKLKRHFKAKFNTTIFSFYRLLQMELAEKLLDEHLYNKKQISWMLKFANQSNFTVWYKKYWEYKARNKSLLYNVGDSGESLIFATVSQAGFPVAVLDAKFRYVGFSKEWTNVFEFKKDGLIGSTYSRILPELKTIWADALENCIENGAVHFNEGQLNLMNMGRPIWITWYIRPWAQINISERFILICVDISHLKN